LKGKALKFLKYLAIFLAVVIGILVLLIFSLRIPAVQNFVKDKLVTYLESKIHTKVALEKVYIGFPNTLEMQNLYLQGQDVDTLLYAGKLEVGLNIPKLLDSRADITSIDLEKLRANVVRKKDGTFNFDYIINAFASSEKEESSSKPFVVSLDKIKLKDIGVSFIDHQSANNINVYFKDFNTRVKTFDLQKNSYAIGDLTMDGLKLKLKQDLVKEIAQKAEKKVDSLNQQSPMSIALNKIKLTNFDIDYGDDNSRTFAKVLFKELNTKVNALDLQKQFYDVDEVNLKGAVMAANLYLPASNSSSKSKESTPSTEENPPMKLLLGKLNLDDVQVAYNNSAVKPTSHGMDFNHLTFRKLNVNMENFKMQNGTFAGKVIKAEIQEKRGLDIQEFRTDFLYGEKQAYLKNLYLKTPKTLLRDQAVLNYNSMEQLTANPGAVEVLLNIHNSQIGFSDILNLVPDLRNTAPFNTYPNAILKVDARARGTVNNLLVQNFQLSGLDQLKVAASGKIRNVMDPDKLFYDLNIREISSSAKVLQKLVPKGTIPSDISLPSFISLKGAVKGTTNDVLIQNLHLTGSDRLKAMVSGKINHLKNPDKLSYDLNIRELSSSSKTIYNLVPKGTIPSNISLPSFITVKGTAKGTTKVVNTNLAISTTLGNAAIKAFVDMSRKNHEKYNIDANLKNLQIGKIIQNKDVGAITGNIHAIGTGFDPDIMSVKANGNIASMQYNGYRYQNVKLDATLNNGFYEAKVLSKDPNADLDLFAAGSIKGNSPSLKVNGSIVKLDLQKLGFYADPMIIAGKLDGDFTNLDPDFLNGYLNLKDFALSDTKEIFALQDAKINAVSTETSNQLTLESQVADVHLSGKYKLTQIFGALQETLNHYYAFQKESKKEKIDPHQYFTFDATIKNDDLIRKFVPDLTNFETITLNGSYNADDENLQIEGNIPQLTYGANVIENATLKVGNESGKLTYNVNLAALKSESFALNKVSLVGDIADNIINYTVNTKDAADKDQFIIAGNMKSLGEITEISLNPDGLMLNYGNWNVNPENKIQLVNGGIIADNFVLSSNGSEISLQSENQSANSLLNIEIKDFKIRTLTEMVKKDSLLADGTINGTAQLRNLTGEMTFDADVKVSDLFVYGSPIGELSAKVNNKTAGLMDADIALSGNDNDVKITGTYNTKASSFDLLLDMNKLQMKTLQGFSMNAITNTEGYLSENLKVQGTTEQPSILGKVKFNDVGMLISQTGSDFRNLNDPIEFTSRGIEFDKFKINDKDGNTLTVNGQVLTKTYRDFAFNLDVNAREFNVVDAEKTSDGMMYGKMVVNANLQIRGDLDLPKVDGRIVVGDKTDFTFVLPQSSPQLQDREGVVEFIDQDQIALQQTIKPDDASADTRLKGMDVNVNIEVRKEAKMSIIIDKTNGDFVELQGEAELTGGIDPSGKTTLVGVYEIQEGGYEMSVSLLKRRFDIQKGSTITWNGEPTAATLDITAIYKTNAAPIDLVEQQIAGSSASEINQYKQKIPFNTLLILKGELMKPDISFDITTEESLSTVSTTVLETTRTKLDQLRTESSEMNKQVFALLLLNRFVGENPFQSQSGVSAATMAKQSVSRILSDQLNNLAGSLIGGVDINFGLESTEDYSSGTKNERTDLNVDISKKLLNDRLKVTVGSNFGIEGDARQNEDMTNIAGNVSFDYALSRDGRYTLRAYRKNEYQVALQGQIIETGVGFIITVDYDKFKEIFERRKYNRDFRKNARTQKEGAK